MRLCSARSWLAKHEAMCTNFNFLWGGLQQNAHCAGGCFVLFKRLFKSSFSKRWNVWAAPLLSVESKFRGFRISCKNKLHSWILLPFFDSEQSIKAPSIFKYLIMPHSDSLSSVSPLRSLRSPRLYFSANKFSKGRSVARQRPGVYD